MNSTLSRKKLFSVYSLNYGNADFELQPIVRLEDGEVFGHEILYRGKMKMPWVEIDRLVISYLALTKLPATAIFVNLSHDGLLSIPDEKFIALAKLNKIYFELTEMLADDHVHTASAEKVNRLAKQGVLFAIDDYGSGRDGDLRLKELSKVDIVKIDKDLLISMMGNESVRNSMSSFLEKCNSSGVQTIAEGVESQDLLDLAQALNFNFAQGFYVDEIANWLSSQSHTFEISPA